MIREVNLENFRGFSHIVFSDFGRMTLISGKNNSGKSSVLEGIFLALDYRAPDSFAVLNSVRGLPVLTSPAVLWEPLFFNLLKKNDIIISLKFENSELKLKYSWDDAFALSNETPAVLNQFISSAQPTYSLKFSFVYGNISESGHFVMGAQGIFRNMEREQNPFTSLPIIQYFHSSRGNSNALIAELFGIVVRKNKKNQIIDILRIIDDSISDMAAVVSLDQSQLYANVRGQWLPLRLAGDGFDRLLLIIASLIAYPNSILMIDEIDAGFHYSVYDKFWEAVMNVAKEQNCQLIATTHSYECLDSAVSTVKRVGMQDDFCYFRLGKNKNGESVAYRYSADLLSSATDDNLEVR